MFNYLIDDSGALTGPVEFPLVPGIGVQLPSNAVTLSIELAPAPEGFAWAYDNGSLQQQVDCRGDIYRTDSGHRETWTVLGELPQGFTRLPWAVGFHVWVDNAWRVDEAAQLAALQLPCPMQPARCVSARQAQAHTQLAARPGLLKRQLQRFAVGRMQPRQPLLQAHLRRQLKAGGKAWVELQRAIQRPLPPTRAQLLLQLLQMPRLMHAAGVVQVAQQRLQQRLHQGLCWLTVQRRGDTGAQQPGLHLRPLPIRQQA